MHEFTFDAKLAAIVTVRAEDYAQARKALAAVLAVDLSDASLGGLSEAKGITITEATLTMDDANGPQLVEVDGGEIGEYDAKLLEAGQIVPEDLLDEPDPEVGEGMAAVAGTPRGLEVAR